LNIVLSGDLQNFTQALVNIGAQLTATPSHTCPCSAVYFTSNVMRVATRYWSHDCHKVLTTYILDISMLSRMWFLSYFSVVVKHTGRANATEKLCLRLRRRAVI